MTSRRTISAASIGAAFLFYAAMLWMAPRVVLLQSDQLRSRLYTRFHVALVNAPAPIAVPQQSAAQGDAYNAVQALIGEAPGHIAVEDSLTTPPMDTPRLLERLGDESIERVHDIAPEEERLRNMDARILEITEADARRNMDIARRLVRPSPEFIPPMEALPALRSRDIEPGNIALEPARLGPRLLVEAIPDSETNGQIGPDIERPPYETAVLEPPTEEDSAHATPLEETVIQHPLQNAAREAREESPYVFMDDLVDIQLSCFTPNAHDPGYFRLQIVPRTGAVIAPMPKDITFVIDASKSMQQRKLDLISRGIGDALERLRPEDRFSILLFRETVSAFTPEPVLASLEQKAAARTFLSGIQSHGQTDVYNALLPVAQQMSRSYLPGIILVATDGRPTTGLQDSRTIINAVTADNNLKNTIFAYGAGNTVNRYLLDLLAYRNKGDAFVSSNIENARSDIAAFIARLDAPILINLAADYSAAVEGEVYPRQLPDFYADKPITMYGRFQQGNDAVFAVRITGQAGETSKEMLFRADLNQSQKGGKDIAQQWAFARAYDIIGEISRRGELPELLDELSDLSNRYNIRTIYDE